jgi:hypothetical protein
MDEPTGADGVVDVEAALQREIDNLADRFPELDRGEIDNEVHQTYSELERNASIRTHLFTVTGAHVSDVLRNRGAHFQPRSAMATDTPT